MIDTHSHIQFKVFDGTRDEVIKRAKKAGVEKIIAVGTDLISSRKAISISNNYPEVFASVGIHPHHVFPFNEQTEIASSLRDIAMTVIATVETPLASLRLPEEGRAGDEVDAAISELESLINNPKVVAIGETGMDKHVYTKTKYDNYLISERLINLQKVFFGKQIQLAAKYDKALIIHNRESVKETLEVLEKNWNKKLERHCVFHFCEPDKRLLDFAKSHNIFIGVDGDVLTDEQSSLSDKNKQEFVKSIPLELLVLETDSPFISPEPKDLKQILDFVSKLLNKDLENLIYKNSKLLFKL